MIELVPVARHELDALLAMVHALGEDEGVPHIATSAHSLDQALFGAPPAIAAHWLQHRDERTGFAIHSWKWGTFTGTRDLYMQALYLAPAYRGQGLGRAAMAALARIALDAGCTRMEWLSVRNKAASRAFYHALGATPADHMMVQRLPADAMRALCAAPISAIS